MAAPPQDYQQQIRQQGFRLTPQRRLILEAVSEIAAHCTPDQVYEQVRGRMSTINRATVYRTLEFFLEIGRVTVAQVVDNQTIYELATIAPHHHLLCQRCQTMVQFNHSYVAPFFAELAQHFDFQINTNHLVLFGLCQGCQQQEG